MKLRLRCHETRETLKLDFADTATLHDLRLRINASSPSSVRLSLNRKDELLELSPEDTLRSLGVTSGDLIYYSLDHSVFAASVQNVGSPSLPEAHLTLVQSGESSNEKLGEHATLARQLEMKQTFVHDSMGIGFGEVNTVSESRDVNMNIQDQTKDEVNLGVEDQADVSTGENSAPEGLEPMDVDEFDVELAGSKRLSEPFFLKKVLLEKSGDTSELTVLVMSVHAVMLESGFLLFDPGSGVRTDKFSFSKELLSVSLRYTLPELITASNSNSNTIESVTVKFQSLAHVVVVYGTLGGTSWVHRVHLDKRRFVPIIELVMDTLKSDKEGSSSIYREVFKFWRMIKDGLVMPLLIGLCDKSGLELPPCLMRLPTELKLKILELLPGESVAKMACLCSEMRYLASDNDLWKRKCLEECKLPVAKSDDSVNWKAKFAAFWRQNQRSYLRGGRIGQPCHRFTPIIRDPFTWFSGDRLHGRFRLHQARGPSTRARGQFFGPRCNLGRLN